MRAPKKEKRREELKKKKGFSQPIRLVFGSRFSYKKKQQKNLSSIDQVPCTQLLVFIHSYLTNNVVPPCTHHIMNP